MYRCDIILLTWDQLNWLRSCVESIFRSTNIPTRLIIIDNGSGSETKRYLSEIDGRHYANIEVVVLTNEKNEGFVRGMNRGIDYSDADYFCLLNNDVLVTPGWLENMIRLGDSHPRIGIINPESNNFGTSPRSLKELDDFARNLSRQNKGKYIEMGQCIGFCMLVKREVKEKIGNLSLEFRQIFFEDTDYSNRAKEVGYLCVLAKDSYVYHYEHRSFRKIRQRNKIFRENQEVFVKKWGKALRIFYAQANIDDYDIETIMYLARTGNFVYIALYKNSPKKVLFIDRHTNIKIITYPGFKLFLWLYLVLSKRKKKYDWVITDSVFLEYILNRLRPLHNAQVSANLEPSQIRILSQCLKFA